MGKRTLVLGASDNPTRFAYLAINMLAEYQHVVFAIGQRNAIVGQTTIEKERSLIKEIDTLTLYINPQRQRDEYSFILALKPRRIIMNPGTENEELTALAKAHGIEVIEACTLVMLRSGQY
ncbi:MAG: CoA-binding protein [Saprospiraceae bacterium]|nr:CoA-binding protein [Saprospiraceae bacterium]